MAVNQVSLSFMTPRWRQRLRPDLTARAANGSPVMIVDPVQFGDGVPVHAETVVSWLSEQEFTVAEWGQNRVFTRGVVLSIFGDEQDIIAHIIEMAGEVTEIWCRFTLPRPGFPDFSTWGSFAVSLSQRFELRLAHDGTGPCSEAEFLTTVRSSRNYREFADAFGWPQ